VELVSNPTLSELLLNQAQEAYWWVAIEGIRQRFGHYQPAWNPSNTGIAGHATLMDDVELLLPLDGDAVDFSGNGRDGTRTGIDDGTGVLGQCAQYREDADKIEITTWTGITGTAARSVAFWCKFPSGLPATDNGDMVFWGTVGTGQYWEIKVRRVGTGELGRIKVSAYGGSKCSSTQVIDGAWHHVVVTCPASAHIHDDVKIYIDGVEESSYTNGGSNVSINTVANYNVHIGYNPTNSHSQYDVDIDQVIIWEKELTLAEVTDLYALGEGLGFAQTGRYINQLLADLPPRIGGQEADPLNGTCRIPSHEFTLLDADEEITSLISVSDTPKAKTCLTRAISDSDTDIPVEDYSDFPASGHLYIDRETIYYTGQSTASKNAQTCSAGLTGQTADGGNANSLNDAGRTEADDYWIGALLTVTAGTNNGESRIITGYWWDEENSKGWLTWDSPMPSACDATTVYSISYPPDRFKCAGLTEASNYWNGAVVLFTAGTNVGLLAWVQSFDGATDMCTLVSPLPDPCDGTSQFNIVLYKLTGASRGLYDSEAADHLITDENGAVVRRAVVDKPPFIKTRMVRIYESRVGCDESEALCSVGYIDDYGLTPDGNAYQFSCSGLLKILGRKFMSDQARARIAKIPLWGGSFIGVSKYDFIANQVLWDYAFALEDGATEGFSVVKIWMRAVHGTLPAAGGTVKVDDEIIHYDERTNKLVNYWSLDPYLKLGGTDIVLDEDGGTLMNQADGNTDNDIETVACLHNRSLFSDKIGAKDVAHSMFARPDAFAESKPGYKMPSPKGMKAFLQEHKVGAEIIQCCLCENSPKSDFPRYDFIEYENLAGGTFAAGDEIEGADNGTVATVMEVDATNATLLLAWADPDNGVFDEGEQISCGGVTADVATYRQEIRPRNNTLDVVLQLLTSTGTTADNGPYDTLPAGMGLGIDQDLVDIDGIEELRDKWFASAPVDFVLHEPTTAWDWLKDNIFRPMQIFPFETYQGKVGLACLMTDAEARVENEDSSATEFDGDHMNARQLPDWTSGKPPIAQLSVRYNKHPTADEFLGKMKIIFGNAATWYKDLGRKVEIDLGCFYYPDADLKRISHKDVKMPAFLRRLTAVMWDRQAVKPCPVITCKTPHGDIRNNVGDIVVVTQANLPNLRTSQRNLAAEYYQIIGRYPEPANSAMRWILWQIGVHDEKYARRAPGAKVSAYAADTPSAGKSTITFYERTFSKPGDKDVSHFSAGMEVMFVSSTYGLIGGVAPEEATIESVNEGSNQVVLDQNLTHAVSDGCFMTYAPFASCTVGQQEGRVFMADEDHLLDDTDSAFKYM